MQVRILAFAQARDILGFSEKHVEASPDMTASAVLEIAQPGASAKLQNSRVALDCEYAGWNDAIGLAQELAIIPPVSGG